MCDPIVVDLLKMLPHYSQSSSENVRDPIQWHIPISLLEGIITPRTRSNPDLSYRNLSPLPQYYHADPPKSEKFNYLKYYSKLSFLTVTVNNRWS